MDLVFLKTNQSSCFLFQFFLFKSFIICFNVNRSFNLFYFDLTRLFGWSKLGGTLKELEESLKEPKNEKKPEKQSNISTCENFVSWNSNLRKWGPTCEILKAQIRKSTFNLQKFLQPTKAPPGTLVPFRKFIFHFHSLQINLRIKLWNGATCESTCEFQGTWKNVNRRLNPYLNP